MDIEQSPTYIALPEHAKPAWLRAIRALPPAWLIAPVLVRSLRAKKIVTNVCKAGAYSRASGSFKEGFKRMGLLAGSSGVSCMVLRL